VVKTLLKFQFVVYIFFVTLENKRKKEKEGKQLRP